MESSNKLETGTIIFVPTENGKTALWQVRGTAICIKTRKLSYVMTRNGVLDPLPFTASDVHELIATEKWRVLNAG